MRKPLASALCIHGAGGGGWEWNVWRGVFEAAGVAMRTPDLMPSKPLGQTRLVDYVEQMRSMLDGMPRPRAVVGASLGGLIGMQVADAADALVLVNPMPPSPWHRHLPRRDAQQEGQPPGDVPDQPGGPGSVVPWGRNARLASTRRAMPDADAASVAYASARWRDESTAVLRDAGAGIEVEQPDCRVLCIASEVDEDIPVSLTQSLATAWRARLLITPSTSHVGPLLGRSAASTAQAALDWLLEHQPAMLECEPD